MTGAAVAAPLSLIFLSIVYHSVCFALAYLVSVCSTIPGLTGSHIEPCPWMELELPPPHQGARIGLYPDHIQNGNWSGLRGGVGASGGVVSESLALITGRAGGYTLPI